LHANASAPGTQSPPDLEQPEVFDLSFHVQGYEYMDAGADISAYYIDVSGSDQNSGSIDRPFATLQHAHDVAQPGDTIYLRGGVYVITTGIHLTRDGTRNRPIVITAYLDERPVLDGSAMTEGGYWHGWVLDLDSVSWNSISGIEIRGGAEGGLVIRGESHHNVIEALDVHHNGRLSQWEGKGISLYGASAENLLLNNDSHHNRDLQGSNADGFQISTTGSGNVLDGNRAWRNSDDGFDLFNVQNNTSAAPVLIARNWAWENGFGDGGERLGDGNGFKLGGRRPGTSSVSGGHTVLANMAWGNARAGFDENEASRPLMLEDNRAYANGRFNFAFWNNATAFAGNLAFGPGEVVAQGADRSNSWRAAEPLSSASFVSLDDRSARAPRLPDGSLPPSPFLTLNRPAPRPSFDVAAALALVGPGLGEVDLVAYG
jgi:hypothetical protein